MSRTTRINRPTTATGRKARAGNLIHDSKAEGTRYVKSRAWSANVDRIMKRLHRTEFMQSLDEAVTSMDEAMAFQKAGK